MTRESGGLQFMRSHSWTWVKRLSIHTRTQIVHSNHQHGWYPVPFLQLLVGTSDACVFYSSLVTCFYACNPNWVISDCTTSKAWLEGLYSHPLLLLHSHPSNPLDLQPLFYLIFDIKISLIYPRSFPFSLTLSPSICLISIFALSLLSSLQYVSSFHFFQPDHNWHSL